MQCRHCAGEIPDRSRFCPICGQRLEGLSDPGNHGTAGQLGVARERPVAAAAQRAYSLAAAASEAGNRPAYTPDPGASEPELLASGSSLLAVPVSRGARLVRLAAVLLVDLVLAGSGLLMISSYCSARTAALAGAPPAAAGGADAAPVPAAIVPLAPVQLTAPQPRPARAAPGGHGRSSRAAGKRSGRNPAAPGTPPGPATGNAGTGEPTAAPGPGSALPAGGGGAEPVTGPAGGTVPPPTGDAPVPGAGAAPPAVGTPATSDEMQGGGDRGEEIHDPAMAATSQRVARVLERHYPQINHCYESAAKASAPTQPLQGTIDVQFVLTPSGKADGVRVVRNTTDSERLASCVMQAVASWDFPREAAEPIEFLWPFVFRAP
jgi:hypothetical protein